LTRAADGGSIGGRITGRVMGEQAIQDELRRFLLTSALTVPHVEAILLLRGDASTTWDARRLGMRLYVSEKRAGELLAELCEKGVVAPVEAPPGYRYDPSTPELAALLDVLADTYARQLVDVTELIHTAADPAARQFAAAFRFRREP
jgi:hypothetical protein